MELEGKVVSVPEMVKIQTQRGDMQRQDIILELPGEFSRKVCIEFWNERATRAAALREGDNVIITFRVDSREYNGRWYTRVSGMNIDYPRPAAPAFDPYTNPVPNQQPNNQYPAYATANTPEVESEPSGASDDLPF